MIKGWKKLNKADLKHLKDINCNHTLRFKFVVEAQQEIRKEGKCEPCWDCKRIATKLGLIPLEA